MKRKAFVLVVIAVYSFVLSPLIHAASVFAEDSGIDIIAPNINLIFPKEAVMPNQKLSIKATITDNGEVIDAVLYYRASNETEYHSVKMKRESGNDFTAEIPEYVVQVPKVDYYMVVSDDAGNKTRKGFSSDPLTISVNRDSVAVSPTINVVENPEDPDPDTPVAAVGEPSQDDQKLKDLNDRLNPDEPKLKKPWYKKWWVWTIAVAVVGGGAAAMAGGGGGDGGGDSGSAAGPASDGQIGIGW